MTYLQNSTDFTVDETQLRNDLLMLKGKKDQVSSAAGEHRSAVDSVLEERGYHKDALNMIRKIDDMPVTKKADVLRSLEPMFKMALEVFWRAEIQDMLDGMDDEKSEMEGQL